VIRLVWALKVPPADDMEGLHEFGLSSYQPEEEIGRFDKSLRQNARFAIWIKFRGKDQLY